MHTEIKLWLHGTRFDNSLDQGYELTLKSTSDYMGPRLGTLIEINLCLHGNTLGTHAAIKLWLHGAKAGNSLWNQPLFTWAQVWEHMLKSSSDYMGPRLGTHSEINLCLHGPKSGNTCWNQALITWGQGWELTLKSTSDCMGPWLGTHWNQPQITCDQDW